MDGVIKVLTLTFLCFGDPGFVVDASTVVVDAPFGKIQGMRKTDARSGQTYLQFFGIPYAKPPVGDLRLAKPQAHPGINNGTLDATKNDAISCPHPLVSQGPYMKYTEDCLILNVQVKESREQAYSLKKVLVFIHGGGFSLGTSVLFDTTSFVTTQDVITVTINYRLGVLGFLSTENEASPGNYGLWDQTLAIRWVKDNIRAFGGDPQDITVAGESAGGSSVGYLTISPHTKGLFTKAYAQSGLSTSVFARSLNTLQHALVIAKSAGCWDGDNKNETIGIEESKSIVTCLRKAPLNVFTSFMNFELNENQFVPRVDGDFVPDSPVKLLLDGGYLNSIQFFDRSYLVGQNNNEGTVLGPYLESTKMMIFAKNYTSAEEKSSAWQGVVRGTKYLYTSLVFDNTAASNETIAAKIDDFYNRRYVDEDPIQQMSTDLCFLIPSFHHLSAAARRTSCNAYFFYFNHFPKFMSGKHRGSPHAIDLAYWFDIDVRMLGTSLNVEIDGGFDDEDLKIRHLLFSIIGDFVKTGNPGFTVNKYMSSCWPKYDLDNAYYLNLSPEPSIRGFLEKDKHDFWLKTLPSLTGSHSNADHPTRPSKCYSPSSGVAERLMDVRIFFLLVFLTSVALMHGFPDTLTMNEGKSMEMNTTPAAVRVSNENSQATLFCETAPMLSLSDISAASQAIRT